MKINPEIHHRKSIRLKNYDYSKKGMYFITICTQNRECILSKIIVGADSISAQKKIMIFPELNETGRMVERLYLNLEKQFQNIKLHDYVIMPNHLHGIIEICKCNRADIESAPTTISTIIQTFKRYTTIEYIKGVKIGKFKPFNKRVWQLNYYEHIIRNEQEYYKICEYIKQNPEKWIHKF